jgi:hypothetical protein
MVGKQVRTYASEEIKMEVAQLKKQARSLAISTDTGLCKALDAVAKLKRYHSWSDLIKSAKTSTELLER